MSATLENIEKIIERTKVSYKDAKEMLESCNGDVVEAIVQIEQKQSDAHEEALNAKKSNYEAKKNVLFTQMKFWGKQIIKLLQQAMTIKVIWKKQDHTYFELPLLIVAILTVWLMPFSLIVLVAPFFFGISTQLQRKNGKVTDVNDWIKTHTGSNSDNQ